MKRQIKVIGPAKFYCNDELITIVEDFELFDLSKVLPMKILQNNLQSDVLSHGKFYGLDDPWFIEEHEKSTALNYGNKHCYLIVEEKTYNAYIEMFHLLKTIRYERQVLKSSLRHAKNVLETLCKDVDEL